MVRPSWLSIVLFVCLLWVAILLEWIFFFKLEYATIWDSVAQRTTERRVRYCLLRYLGLASAAGSVALIFVAWRPYTCQILATTQMALVFVAVACADLAVGERVYMYSRKSFRVGLCISIILCGSSAFALYAVVASAIRARTIYSRDDVGSVGCATTLNNTAALFIAVHYSCSVGFKTTMAITAYRMHVYYKRNTSMYSTKLLSLHLAWEIYTFCFLISLAFLCGIAILTIRQTNIHLRAISILAIQGLGQMVGGRFIAKQLSPRNYPKRFAHWFDMYIAPTGPSSVDTTTTPFSRRSQIAFVHSSVTGEGTEGVGSQTTRGVRTRFSMRSYPFLDDICIVEWQVILDDAICGGLTCDGSTLVNPLDIEVGAAAIHGELSFYNT